MQIPQNLGTTFNTSGKTYTFIPSNNVTLKRHENNKTVYRVGLDDIDIWML